MIDESADTVRLMTTTSHLRIALFSAALAVLSPFAAVSATAATTAGSDSAVTSGVAASAKINKLSSSLMTALTKTATDTAWSAYPALGTGCSGANSCVFGDTSSSTNVVLFGDSHAAMWLPALDRITAAHHERLVVLWHGMCPVANLDVNAPTFGYPSYCNDLRASSISIIHNLNPKLVLIGEKTSSVPGMRGTLTAADWLPALSSSVNAIKSATTKVAIIEDTASFKQSVPQCLSQHVSSVQKCSTTWSTSKPGLQSTQQAVAKSTGSLFVQTEKWFCTKTCSPVIGNFIAYQDGTHISASYSSYLSGVLGTALKSVL